MMVVFPEPQIAELSGAMLQTAGGARIELGANAGESAQHAAALLESAFGAGDAVRVVIGTAETHPASSPDMLEALEGKPNSQQGYVLTINSREISIAAATELGVLYGAQTLIQMKESDGRLPEGTIVDWPERKYRGIFAESRWCSELMTLQDWKDAVDLLASLKFNVFDVGIANNWMIQYEGKRSEFLLTPIKKYPQLRAPQSIEYYSAKQGDYVRAEYLPRMFEEDFFGELVAYGAQRGVTVYPHFNTPGHNTLIPHKIPEISSKDANGEPVGYGFCLSNPKTYEVMFDILDEIVDRYLLPNGVRFFHLGLDEVYPILGMDEEEPTRVVSPYCLCEECAKHEWYDQFIDYTIALCKHLADKGIEKIGLWHDSFRRGGKINEELAERFRREGILDNVVLHWWRYSDFFETIHPELGISSWVVPMTGYYYWIPLADHLSNIYLATQKGAQENAEGAESYCVYYNGFYRNYACLSEYSWNHKGQGDVDAFREKFTRFLFGDAVEGQKAFKHFDFATGPMGPTNWNIYYYSNAYGLNRHSSYIRSNYPQVIVEQIWDNPAGVLHNLAMICEHTRAAKRIFDEASLWRNNPAGLREAYSAEMARTAASAHLFMRLAQTTRAYRDAQKEPECGVESLKAAVGDLDKALTEMDDAIALIEENLPHYMQPSLLRELSLQRRFAHTYRDEVGRAVAGLEGETVSALPDVECLRLNEIRWVGKAHTSDD